MAQEHKSPPLLVSMLVGLWVACLALALAGCLWMFTGCHRKPVTLADFGYLAENAMDGRVECRTHLEVEGDWYTLYRENGEPAWCLLGEEL